jgi:multiple sugar transport system substrate-binding protein
MKKFWLVLFVVLVSITGFFASGLIEKAAAASAQSAAERAVEAAKKYSGITLNVFYEAGLQPLDPKKFTGPMWEKLTGIKINVIESPLSEMFTKTIQAHKAGSGAYDVINVVPNQMPDMVQVGAIIPLDDFVEKYGYHEELQKIAPVYRDNQMKVNGKIYGFPDDGDALVLYYRKDVFTDPDNQTEFKAKYGYDLAAPKTWKQFSEIGQFITDKYAPKMYGAGLLRQPGNAQYMVQERFRVEGGKFFDPETMKATINSPIGVKVFREMREENKFMPPGIEQWGFIEAFNAFLSGQIAMTISWPPVGRWAAGYGKGTEALNWIPETKVADKVGYALPPGGRPELAVGFSLAVTSGSKHKEAAYLFIQWMNSEEISLQRVQLPYALRDPFRTSHFESAEYRSRWSNAGEYLDTLKAGSETGLLDLSLIQTDRYEEGIRQAITRLWAGDDPKTILDDLAAQWDKLTQRIGLEKQKSVYIDWASKPNAYPN